MQYQILITNYQKYKIKIDMLAVKLDVPFEVLVKMPILKE